jgi:hypothetical protein
MVLPDAACADRLAHGIDTKYQESSLIPLASVGLSFKEIRIDEQVPFVIAGQYVLKLSSMHKRCEHQARRNPLGGRT